MADQQVRLAGAPRWWRVRAWPMWESPPAALALIVSASLVSVGLVILGLATNAYPVERWSLAALITAMAVVHTEVVIGTEQIRKRTFNTRPTDIGHIDLTSVWTFAAALTLPAPVAAVATYVVLLHLWLRVLRPAGNPAYRAQYSRATSMLACFATAAVLSIRPEAVAEGVPTIAEFGVVVLALIAYTVTNSGLVILAITFAQRARDVRPFLGSWHDNSLELSSLGLGAVIGLLLSGDSPWMTVLLLPMLIFLHRAVTVQELERSADTDPETDVLNNAAWHRDARRQMRRLARRRQSAALMLIDIDDFGALNARSGYRVGDEVLASVGAALRTVSRPDDVLGRYGADCFAVLIVGLAPAQVESTAQRFADAVAGLGRPTPVDAVTQDAHTSISASVGAARFPDDGLLLEDQLRSAERALREAKSIPGSVAINPSPRGAALQEFRRERARRY